MNEVYFLDPCLGLPPSLMKNPGLVPFVSNMVLL